MQARRTLTEMVEKLENEKERDVIIDQRHYRTIIGSKGDKIKEIKEKFNQVQINFPGPGNFFYYLIENWFILNFLLSQVTNATS